MAAGGQQVYLHHTSQAAPNMHGIRGGRPDNGPPRHLPLWEGPGSDPQASRHQDGLPTQLRVGTQATPTRTSLLVLGAQRNWRRAVGGLPR